MVESSAVVPSTRFTIAGRVYELVPFLKKGEWSVRGDVMVERAKELNANLGEEDCRFILEHQDQIPEEFQGKFFLIFTAWRHLSGPQRIAYLEMGDYYWYQDWAWLDDVWCNDVRLVRRVS